MPSSSSIRSMTGFAQVRLDTEAGELSISLRGVNHRGLDLHFHHSHEFSPFENGMRSLLKEKVSRGHLEVRAGFARQTSQHSSLNVNALRQYAELFQQAAEGLRVESKPDLNAFLHLPGVVTQSVESAEITAGFETVLLGALGECADIFNECRQREGEKLADQMAEELAQVERGRSEMQILRQSVLPAFHQRLRERMRELLNGSNIPDARMVEECAILADRSDVQEELTRLSVHCGELGRILKKGGAIGKQIDFLLQEMNRETNTILAKSSTAGDAGLKITSLGLMIKASIERIREQALNLE